MSDKIKWLVSGRSSGKQRHVAHTYIHLYLTDMCKIDGLESLLKNIKDMPEEYSRLVDEHFWDLI